MFTFFVFVLLAGALILLSMFVDGLIELHKVEKEERKNISRDGMEGYLDQTFGFGNVTLYRTILDADGNVRYLIYLPKYEWFKEPKYQWFEVYATNNGYQHSEVSL